MTLPSLYHYDPDDDPFAAFFNGHSPVRRSEDPEVVRERQIQEGHTSTDEALPHADQPHQASRDQLTLDLFGDGR